MSNSLRLPRKMHFMSENEHGTCTRALSRKRENRDTHFMRACAVEMDMRPTQNAATTRANPDLNPALNSYRKNPLVRSTIWGKTDQNKPTPKSPRLSHCRHSSFTWNRCPLSPHLQCHGIGLDGLGLCHTSGATRRELRATCPRPQSSRVWDASLQKVKEVNVDEGWFCWKWSSPPPPPIWSAGEKSWSSELG